MTSKQRAYLKSLAMTMDPIFQIGKSSLTPENTKAIAEALGDKAGIKRYGSFLLPMDETLALCAIDLSGRPYLNFQAEFPTEHIGGLDTEMIKEFFYAVSYSAAMNLHLKIMDGGNSHHMAEALFKAFGKALDAATMEEPRMKDVWSTKGSL